MAMPRQLARYWATHRRGKRKKRKNPRRVSVARRRYRRWSPRRRRSGGKSSPLMTMVKLALGAYAGNWLGGKLASYVDKDGTKPLYRAAGALAGAYLVKRFAGKKAGAIGTGAAAMLAGHAALDFSEYWKQREAKGGS